MTSFSRKHLFSRSLFISTSSPVSSAGLDFYWDSGGHRCADTSHSQPQLHQQANQVCGSFMKKLPEVTRA